MADLPLVTITGISGFIGSRVCLDFLLDGGFRVRGTVRDKSDVAKLDPLKKAFGEAFERLELAEADLLNADSIAAAIAGSAYVVHVASPFFYGATEDEMVKPAVEGTIAIMNACKAEKVQRLVLTSSIASCSNLGPERRAASGGDVITVNETFWSEPDRPQGMSAYAKSKTLAEKAAWDFLAALPEAEKFELVALLPSAVMGPPFRKEGFQSGETAKKLLEGSFETIVNGTDAFVDVREVAEAHLKAVKVKEAANRRILVVAETLKWGQIAKILTDEFGPKGFKAHARESEKVDPIVTYYDNAVSKEVLGVRYRPMQGTMVDMVNAMLEIGFASPPS